MSNTNRFQSDAELRREELRGLFTLGLLAILVVIRSQYEQLMVKIGQSSFDFIPLISITIILWSLYAFFMVLGLSDDVIGKTLATMFWNLSKLFLQIDFIWSAFFGTLYFILGYPSRSLWILGLVGAMFLFVILLSLRKIKLKDIWKKPKITRLDLLKRVTLILFLIFVTTLFYYPDERYLIVFFVLGLLSFIAFGLISEKQSEAGSKTE
jgi:hypothetical protein